MKYKIQKKITAGLGLTALMLCVSAQPAFADTKAGQEAMEQTVVEQAADQPAVLTAPNLTKLETAEGDTVSIEWSTVEGADFYRVYRSATKTGGYKLVKTVFEIKTMVLLGEYEPTRNDAYQQATLYAEDFIIHQKVEKLYSF